jgi:hypothetical protein
MAKAQELYGTQSAISCGRIDGWLALGPERRARAATA